MFRSESKQLLTTFSTLLFLLSCVCISLTSSFLHPLSIMRHSISSVSLANSVRHATPTPDVATAQAGLHYLLRGTCSLQSALFIEHGTDSELTNNVLQEINQHEKLKSYFINPNLKVSIHLLLAREQSSHPFCGN